MNAKDYQDATWSFLKSKGLNDYSAAAVMGNIQGESSFNPNAIEDGNGIGIGLCQWSYGRRTQITAYGLDLTHQFNFLWSELTGQDLAITGASYQWINKSGYLNQSQFMSGSGSLNELTSAFCFCWERPNVLYAHLDVRQNAANTFYNTYAQGGATLPPVDPPTNPATPGDIKLKNKYLYGATDKLFGRKFTSPSNTFTLISTTGDCAKIMDGNKVYYVPKNNIIQ